MENDGLQQDSRKGALLAKKPSYQSSCWSRVENHALVWIGVTSPLSSMISLKRERETCPRAFGGLVLMAAPEWPPGSYACGLMSGMVGTC